ncbi:LysR family transcriptional regulator [Vagococcus fluvialis]|uniref:LysR family transcriptional regulator n=1 Tax=Vagococcus fluvialis TaxID=2738 RepID=UPI003B5C4597
MELRQIHYFLVLAKELHFSEAAVKLGISQPSLSQQIKVLESEIGMPLFDRIGKKNSLTEAGRLLYRYAVEMEHVLDNFEGELADLREENRGEIRVAMLPSDLDYRMGDLLSEFYQDYPEIKIKVIASIEIEKLLLQNDVDFGLGIKQQVNNQLIQKSVFTETYDLYISKKLEKTFQEPVLAIDIEELPLIMFPSGFYGRELLDKWAKSQKITLNPIMEISSAMSQFQLAEKGIGMTIQPQQLKNEIIHQNIVALEIEQPPTREVVITYMKNKYLTKAMADFMERLSFLF